MTILTIQILSEIKYIYCIFDYINSIVLNYIVVKKWDIWKEIQLRRCKSHL